MTNTAEKMLLMNTPTMQSNSTEPTEPKPETEPQQKRQPTKEEAQAVRRNYLRLWGRGHLREDLQKMTEQELADFVNREVLHL